MAELRKNAPQLNPIMEHEKMSMQRPRTGSETGMTASPRNEMLMPPRARVLKILTEVCGVQHFILSAEYPAASFRKKVTICGMAEKVPVCSTGNPMTLLR